MLAAVGARSLRCSAITAADTDSDIRANPDQRRRQPATKRMILESFGELEDKISFFPKDGLEDHDEHDCTSTIRHNSFRVHVKIRNCGDAHDGTRGRRICAL